MKTITEVTQLIQANAKEIEITKDQYQKRMDDLIKEERHLLKQRSLLLADINLSMVELAESILMIEGDVSRQCERDVISELAANHIATKGGVGLRTSYYGNKRYDGFYQRCDCKYGYGPSHGSIVERVGFKSEFRERDLTADEKEACIYYLLNFAKIYKAKKEVNS